MFKAIVSNPDYPITVLRLSDSSEFYDCVLLAYGNVSYSIKKGDTVLCSIDEDDTCYVFGTIPDPADQTSVGMQVGDNSNGVTVSPDGKTVVIRHDNRKILINEDGIDIDSDHLRLNGDGFTLEIDDASKNGATSMKTKATLTFKSLIEGQDASFTLEGDQTGNVTLTSKIGQWEQTLKNDGTLSVSNFTKIKLGDAVEIKPDGSVKVGSSGSDAAVLGNKLQQQLDQLVNNLNTHTHPVASGATATGPIAVPLTSAWNFKSTKIKLTE